MKFTDSKIAAELSPKECNSIIGGGFFGDVGQFVGGGALIGLTELTVGIPSKLTYKLGKRLGSKNLEKIGRKGHMAARGVGKAVGLYDKGNDESSLND
jgi:hypothetical protein